MKFPTWKVIKVMHVPNHPPVIHVRSVTVSLCICVIYFISQGEIFVRIFQSLKTLVYLSERIPPSQNNWPSGFRLKVVFVACWLSAIRRNYCNTVTTFGGMCGVWKETPNKLDIYHPVWDISIHFAPFLEPPIAKPCKIPPTSSTLPAGKGLLLATRDDVANGPQSPWMGSMDWDGMVEPSRCNRNGSRNLGSTLDMWFMYVYVVFWVSKFGSHPNSAKQNLNSCVRTWLLVFLG
jgi:hypothetical protein